MFYMDNANLKIGSDVTSGQQIGPAQDVRQKHGFSMTPHVHYEVYKNGQLIDPASVFPELKP